MYLSVSIFTFGLSAQTLFKSASTDRLLQEIWVCYQQQNTCCTVLSSAEQPSINAAITSNLSHYFASKIVPNHCCINYTEFQTSFGDVRSLTISAGAPLSGKSCPSLEIRALTLGCSSLSFSCSISCYLLLKSFTPSSPSSSLGNRATPRILFLNNVPKWSLSTFIYPIRVILMTFHLQWTRLDLGQEIYGWDLIFHSLKSPKWTLHQIFLFEKSYYPKYLKVHFMT